MRRAVSLGVTPLCAKDTGPSFAIFVLPKFAQLGSRGALPERQFCTQRTQRRSANPSGLHSVRPAQMRGAVYKRLLRAQTSGSIFAARRAGRNTRRLRPGAAAARHNHR